MRVPQRSFVVEFKSRSRQTKAGKPTSIWGDTDLKAVARKVEEQSAHLFEQPTDKPVINAPAAQPEVSLPVHSPLERPSPVSKAEAPAAEAQTTLAVAMERTDGSSETAEPAPTTSKTAASQGTKARKTNSRVLRSKRAATPRTAPVAALDVRETFVSPADLDALDTENTRLKAQLCKRLSTENAHLAALLLRFS